MSLPPPHPPSTVSSSRSPSPPQLGVRLFLFSPLHSYLFIFIWLQLSFFPSLPPSGSLLFPRSGLSGAPPLARRDVARGDVDAGVSGALDVCAQPGPRLQGRRRPLRRLLEQQQPQVRQWERRAGDIGPRRPAEGAAVAAGTSAHQPPAARTLGACVAKALMAFEAPTGSAPVAPLFVKLPQRGRESLGVPGAAQTGCLRGARGDSEKAGAGESRSLCFLTRASGPAPRSGRSAWAPRAPGARRQEFPPGAWVRRDCRENPPNIPKVGGLFFCFLIFLPFFRCVQRAHRVGEARGGWEAEALGFYFSLNCEAIIRPLAQSRPGAPGSGEDSPTSLPPWAQGARKFDLMPGYVICAERTAGVGRAGRWEPLVHGLAV